MRLNLLIALLATFTFALRAADEKPEPKPVKEESIRLEKSDFQPLVETEGTLEPAVKKVLRVLTEESPGPFPVLEALPSGRKVEAGTVVVKLDTAALDRTLRAAREGMENIRKKYETMNEEYATLMTTNKIKLERMQLDYANAQRDQKIFEKFGEESMLKGKELTVKGQEFQTAERADELAQLEKMYKDTQLATDTKEIVLERARKSSAISQQWLDLTRKSEQQLKEFDHPQRKELITLAVEQKKQDLDLFKVTSRLAEAAKTEELGNQQRWMRDNTERLARLESDLAQLTLKAPIAGYVINRGLDAGDKAAAGVPLAEIWDLEKFNIRFACTASDLTGVKVGDKAKVRLRDFPAEELEAKIDEISITPTGDDKGGVRYAVKASLNDSKLLRPGMKARVEFKHEKLKKTVTLPRSAVIYKDDRTWAKVRNGDKIETREIVLGPGDRDRVSVEKGLSDGDIVVIKEGSK
jgi:RND family efflux transporter MFP subunit